MTLEAVIFDMDGTLVDTNETHVEAWRRAFERCGFSVPTERIVPEVGKGGDMLVPAILGESAEREHGETLRRYNGEEFLQRAGPPNHYKNARREITDLRRILVGALTELVVARHQKFTNVGSSRSPVGTSQWLHP